MTSNKWPARSCSLLGSEEEFGGRMRSRGSGPTGVLALGLMLALPRPPLGMLPTSLSSRSDAVHGVWVCGVQEARAGPESPQAAPGKVRILSRGPCRHLAGGGPGQGVGLSTLWNQAGMRMSPRFLQLSGGPWLKKIKTLSPRSVVTAARSLNHSSLPRAWCVPGPALGPGALAKWTPE